MTKTKVSILALLIVTTFSYPVSSPDAKPESKHKFTDSEIVQIMRDAGYSSVKKTEDGFILIKIDEKKFVIYNYKGGDIQAYYGAKGPKISYKDINTWNKKRRLSRAYIDSRGDPVIEADLLSDGGMTAKNITEFFKVFVDVSVSSFRQFVMLHMLFKHRTTVIEDEHV